MYKIYDIIALLIKPRKTKKKKKIRENNDYAFTKQHLLFEITKSGRGAANLPTTIFILDALGCPHKTHFVPTIHLFIAPSSCYFLTQNLDHKSCQNNTNNIPPTRTCPPSIYPNKKENTLRITKIIRNWSGAKNSSTNRRPISLPNLSQLKKRTTTKMQRVGQH